MSEPLIFHHISLLPLFRHYFSRLEKERLAHRLERVCDPSQNTDDCMAAIELSALDHDDNGDKAPNGHTSSHSSRSKSRQSMESKDQHRSPTPEAPSIAFPVVARPTTRVFSPQPIELISEESSESRSGCHGNVSRKVPTFIVSGMSNEERVEYGALIEELGGKMLDKQHFDTSCTHLVVGQPVRNEKYLSSVAAGNWVLHKSYFEACRKEGRLVKEENHEWGSDYTLPVMQSMTSQAYKLAAAAHKWRKRLSAMRKVWAMG